MLNLQNENENSTDLGKIRPDLECGSQFQLKRFAKTLLQTTVYKLSLGNFILRITLLKFRVSSSKFVWIQIEAHLEVFRKFSVVEELRGRYRVLKLSNSTHIENCPEYCTVRFVRRQHLLANYCLLRVYQSESKSERSVLKIRPTLIFAGGKIGVFRSKGKIRVICKQSP